MKTQDCWDIRPYRLVVTNASKDRNAFIFRVKQYTKSLLRRLDLEDEKCLPVHMVWLIKSLKSSATAVWKPQIFRYFTFPFWLLIAVANKRVSYYSSLLSLSLACEYSDDIPDLHLGGTRFEFWQVYHGFTWKLQRKIQIIRYKQTTTYSAYIFRNSM
jgi:hypothetical protein